MKITSACIALVCVSGLIVVGGLVACNQQQPAEIKVGVLAILTGSDLETSGQQTVNAAKLAVQQVNDAGGLDIGGRRYKITLVIADDGNNPETAVLAAQKLINQDNVMAIVGPQYSKNAIPVADVAEKAHVPMISPMSTNPQTTAGKQYVFRVGFIDDFQGQVIARFVKEDLAASTAAVLYDIASAYNKGIAEIFDQTYEQLGGQVVAFESYTTGDQDFSRQLARIKDSNPQVLFLPNYSEDVLIQAQQARSMGITAILLGSDGWDPIKLAAVPELDGAFYSGHWHVDSTREQSQAFVKAYRQAYGTETFIDTMAMTYDAFGLLFNALQSQGKADSEAIRAGLAATKAYEGVSGTIGYQGTGDPVKSAVILQIKDNKADFYQLVSP